MDWFRVGVKELSRPDLNTLLDDKDFGAEGYLALQRIRSYVNYHQDDHSNKPIVMSINEWCAIARKSKKKFFFFIEKLREIGLISYNFQDSILELSTVQTVRLKCDTDKTRNARQATFREKHKEFSSKNKSRVKDEKVTVVTPTDTDTDSESICINTNTDTKKEENVCNVSVSLPNSCLSREALKAEAVNQVMNHEQFKSLDESHRDVFVESMVKFMETCEKETLLGKTNVLKSILNKKAWGLSKEFSAMLVSNNPKVQPKTTEMPSNRIPPTSKDWDLDVKIKDSEDSYNFFMSRGRTQEAISQKKHLDSLLAQKSKVA